MKKLVSALLAAVMILSLAACGSNTSTAPAPDGSSSTTSTDTKKGDVRISIGGGNTTGVYYILAGALANLVNEKSDNVIASAEVTGASIENCNLIHAGELEMGVANTDISMYAYNGETDNFPEAMPELRHIAKLYTSTMNIVVSADSDIHSVADLKGKKVAVGSPGAGQRVYVQEILEEYGLTMNDIQVYDLSQSEAVDAMKDNQIDAAFIHSGHPNSAVADLAASKNIRLISLDESAVESLTTKYPYLGAFTIPADAYGTDSDALAVGAWNSLICVDSLDEDTVYQVTKLMFENLDYLASCHDILKNIDVTKACTEEIPLHEGAIRYYKEIGLM